MKLRDWMKPRNKRRIISSDVKLKGNSILCKGLKLLEEGDRQQL